jgi:hypothetical protein
VGCLRTRTTLRPNIGARVIISFILFNSFNTCYQSSVLEIIIIIINMLMPVQKHSFTHVRVLLVLTNRGF